jgi:hypothetical protein
MFCFAIFNTFKFSRNFADSFQSLTKRTCEERWDNGWDIKWAEIPYEIDLIFIPASRTGPVNRASSPHMNRALGLI